MKIELEKIIKYLENKDIYINDEVYYPWYNCAINELNDLLELLENNK
jgi:hypothetical protein